MKRPPIKGPRHCWALLTYIKLPMAIDSFVAKSSGFIEAHRGCEPVAGGGA